MTTDQQINEIHAMLRALCAHLGVRVPGVAQPAQHRTEGAPPAGGQVADDRELDSQYGDPEIRKDPPRYSGPSMVGKHYSETTAEYLGDLAGFLEWKAGKNEEEGTPDKIKYAGYDRRDAARARGWMARLRDNPVAQTPPKTPASPSSPSAPVRAAANDPADAEYTGEDDIPF